MGHQSSATKGAITGCHHFAICVHDIDAAREFYGSALALEEIERPEAVAKQFRSAWYRIGRSELHVVESNDFTPMDSPIGPHLAVTTDDFEATVERLQTAGLAFRFGPGKGPDGVLRAIVTDPTGNVFEITDAPAPR